MVPATLLGGGARQGLGPGASSRHKGPQAASRAGKAAVLLPPRKVCPPAEFRFPKGGRPEKRVQGEKPGGGKQHCRDRPPRLEGVRLADDREGEALGRTPFGANVVSGVLKRRPE